MNSIESQASGPPARRVSWLEQVSSDRHPANPSCHNCEAAGKCQVFNLAAGGLVAAMDSQIGARAVRAGEHIYRSGDVFRSLYIPRCGICKNVRFDRDGHQQITGFRIAGECFGTDGIASGRHESEAIALQDMQVCVLPYLPAEALADKLPEVHRGLERMLSKELGEREALLMLVSNQHAEQRIAAFLMDLGARYAERTLRPGVFPLVVSREDIGSHLGLTLETVSRTFSRLRQRGLIDWEGRVIHMLDSQGLAQI